MDGASGGGYGGGGRGGSGSVYMLGIRLPQQFNLPIFTEGSYLSHRSSYRSTKSQFKCSSSRHVSSGLLFLGNTFL